MIKSTGTINNKELALIVQNEADHVSVGGLGRLDH